MIGIGPLEKETYMNRSILVGAGFVLILIGLLAACQSGFATGKGRIVKEEYRIDLPSQGYTTGNWQGRRRLLTCQYTINTDQEAMLITGEIRFVRQVLWTRFVFNVVLIDEEGAVILILPIARTAKRQEEVEMLPLNRELQLPPGTQYFTFSYSGQASGVGDMGSPKSFWSKPW